jgi:hypothetical protein
MIMELCNNTFWKMVSPMTLKRMNLTDNAPVNKAFFESDMLQYIGIMSTKTLRTILFNEHEWHSFCWNWNTHQMDYDPVVHLFKFTNKQYLPRGRIRNSFHFEVWVFGMFLGSDDRYYMCPLRKESDFDHDIFSVLRSSATQSERPIME